METCWLKQLRGSLIVSCQARAGEPFDPSHFIAEFAKAASMGGAAGVRINSEENIRAVKEVVTLLQ